MNENYLGRIFEYNNWANRKILDACRNLTDAQLDADPASATYGSIRKTLVHLAAAQKGYLRLLTLPFEQRNSPVTLTYDEVWQTIQESGEALLAIALDPSGIDGMTRIRTRDSFHVEPWVLLVQIINHGDEHREQIKSMLTALGITPPNMDGWMYGEAVGDMVPVTT
ncbi:MAG: hypothetical protein K8I30_13565 [Anaerolineae bacterium]|nr:hypothetical protein [Anaerolineae bacterium]